MGDDASLDDFATGDSVRADDETNSTSGGEPGDAGDVVESGSRAQVEGDPNAAGPDADSRTADPEATGVAASSWRPDARCERCGNHATRRFRDGDRLVCPDCSTWE